MIAIKIGLKSNVEKDETQCEVDIWKGDYSPKHIMPLSHDCIMD
jgi:hypothetical protein